VEYVLFSLKSFKKSTKNFKKIIKSDKKNFKMFKKSLSSKSHIIKNFNDNKSNNFSLLRIIGNSPNINEDGIIQTKQEFGVY